MRLSKAPRKVYQHADVDAAPGDPRRGRRERPRGDRRCPYRLILVVTDGVFSMDGDIAPLPGIVEAAESRQRGGLRRRRPRLGRARPRRPRLGRPLRAPRPGRDPGRDAEQGGRRARRLRRRLAGPARHPRPARPAVPLLDVPSAGGRRRLPRGDPGHAGGARAASSGCGRTPGGSRPSSPGSASTPAGPRRRSRR